VMQGMVALSASCSCFCKTFWMIHQRGWRKSATLGM